MVFFTSDHHFNHKNIIKYCNRPFSSVEEMDNTMIKNWNSVVKPSDIVYHLGDFCLSGDYETEQYFRKLNGLVYVLTNKDHHDKRWLKHYDSGYPMKTKHGQSVYLVNSIETLKFPKLPPIVLCHFPIYYWDMKHYLSWHLYGHVHDKKFEIPNSHLSYNVGVDMNYFTPVSLDFITTIMLERVQRYNLIPIERE